MNQLLAFLKSKNITSHSVTLAIVGASTLVMTDEAVRSYILSLFAQHPKIGTAIVGLAGIIFKYTSGNSAAGTVAAAQTIQAGPDAPTASQVDAVKTKP